MSETIRPGTKENPEIVSLNVFIDDKDQPIDSEINILQLEVSRAVNKIPWAKLTIIDGDVTTGEFPAMDSNAFQPGVALRFELGYGTGGENQVVFKGVIVEVDSRMRSGQSTELVIHCLDVGCKLAFRRRFRSFHNLSLGDVTRKILEDDYSDGPAVNRDDGLSDPYPTLLQYDQTDWAFLRDRAQAEGSLIYLEDGQLSLAPPAGGDVAPSLTVTFGQDILAHHLRFSARSLLPETIAKSWNATDQEIRSELAEELDFPHLGLEHTSWNDFIGQFAKEPQKRLTHSDLDTPVVGAWAKAEMRKNDLRKISGQITVPGTVVPKLNTGLEIFRLGKYFSGIGLITAVAHEVVGGQWRTVITLGLPRDIFAELGNSKNGISPYASVSGLKIGLVVQMHDDPAGNGRVLVKLPGTDEEGEGIWARLASVYAGKQGSTYFYPEIGNEVVLGFLDDDPQSPIILGSLHSQANSSALAPEEKNHQKGIVLSSGLQLLFDEEREEISLSTPGGNRLVISDTDKEIRLEDQHGNRCVMGSDGVTIASSGKLELEASKDFFLSSQTSGTIKVQSSLDLEGMNVVTKARAKIEHQANILQAKGTAQMVLKGGVVRIN